MLDQITYRKSSARLKSSVRAYSIQQWYIFTTPPLPHFSSPISYYVIHEIFKPHPIHLSNRNPYDNNTYRQVQSPSLNAPIPKTQHHRHKKGDEASPFLTSSTRPTQQVKQTPEPHALRSSCLQSISHYALGIRSPCLRYRPEYKRPGCARGFPQRSKTSVVLITRVTRVSVDFRVLRLQSITFFSDIGRAPLKPRRSQWHMVFS